MGYKVKMNFEALEDFEKLDNSVKIQITKFINRLEERENPRTLGEALKNNLVGCWRYKVDNYRIIAEIQDDKLVILMIAIGHRSTIYKIVDKRLN